MIIRSKQADAIAAMNEFGARGVPFLFIIDYAMRSSIIMPLAGAADERIYFDLNGRSNVGGLMCQEPIGPYSAFPVSFEEYSRAFRGAMDALSRGDTYLLNLTFPTRIKTDTTLEAVFHAASARYKLLVRDEFVVFSPESFVRISGGMISSFPMKGTIDASVPDAKERILADPKERAEHTTIVDLIRNDLGIVSDNVRVERFRYIDTVRSPERTLLQVSSEIRGELPEGFEARIGSILFKLLPAGSVTGAPKKRTVEVIDSIEPYRRGYYTGIFGYFDGAVLDSGVMIRFIEKTDDGYFYRSGGGITVHSDCRKEYKEMIDKVYVPIL